MNNQGLTGIREDARGFVGNKPSPARGMTKTNKLRIKFNIACGQNKEELGKYTTWRYCTAYNEVAKSLNTLKPGDLVKVSGWVTTECVRDENYQPVEDSEGRISKREYLILYKAEITDYQKNNEYQPELLTGVPN